MYDAASRINEKMKDFIDNNSWVLPSAVSAEHIYIINHRPKYRPNIDREGEVVWSMSNNGNFSIKYVWEKMRRRNSAVTWHKDSIPRCSFISWLACKNRLRTKEMLLRWGLIEGSRCVLCGRAEETRDHSFFQCAYSKYV